MESLLSALRKAEQALVVYDQNAPPSESPVAVVPGTQPILISAPHSARHWRSPDWKQEEEYTAALAYVLAQATGAYCIYARYLQGKTLGEGFAGMSRTATSLAQRALAIADAAADSRLRGR